MRKQSKGFTIVELLVVVSIIALLIGILLPAIQNARQQALLSESKSNVKNISTAHALYGAEWNDRQFTMLPDSFCKYGATYEEARANYLSVLGTDIPVVWAGQRENILYGINRGNGSYQPIDFTTGFGAFRMVQARPISNYVNNRWYDPVFYAPKDTMVMETVEPLFADPEDWIPSDMIDGVDAFAAWSSYCTSPAALWSPDVFSDTNDNGQAYNEPYELVGGARAPAYSNATFPTLKTHVMEHNWLQQRVKECSNFFDGGTYNGCEPFYFNHGYDSAPVAAFYDGHVDQIGVQTATRDNIKIFQQEGVGLWSDCTPLGGENGGCGAAAQPFEGGSGAYFCNATFDWSNVNFHVLTRDGIKGRDKVAQ